MLSVFQFLRFFWASWRREGYWIPPKTCNSGRLHNLTIWDGEVCVLSTLICECVDCHIWMSHVMSDISMRQVCVPYTLVCEYIICETWLVGMWDMTQWYVRHDSVLSETWLIGMWDMTHWYERHASLICETCLRVMRDMTHWYVRRDSLIRETRLIDMRNMTHRAF